MALRGPDPARHRSRPRPRSRCGPGGRVAGRTAYDATRCPVGPRARRPRARVNYDEGRAQYPVLERIAYLNAGTNGPLARATVRGCNTVVAGLDLTPEDEIVTTDSEHFGLIGPLHASRARVVVAAPDEESILAAVTPRTRLIAVSHVLW